jgi:putative transposase
MQQREPGTVGHLASQSPEHGTCRGTGCRGSGRPAGCAQGVYPFIEAEKQEQRNVKRACELLQVSRAVYYAARDGQPSRREQDDAELTEAIKQAHVDSKGPLWCSAHPRRAGRRHGKKRIARLRRAAKIRGRTPKRWKKTTIADPAAAARADLVRRDFSTNAAALNARWRGDLTYVPTWESWLYLATVIDIASRRVVGFAMADHLCTELVADALSNAVAARNPTAKLIFHSDTDCPYTSREWIRTVRRVSRVSSTASPASLRPPP